MKNLLKKLNIVPNPIQGEEDVQGSGELSVCPSPSPHSQPHRHEHKPFTALVGWFHTVTSRKSRSPRLSLNLGRQDKMEDNLQYVGSGRFDIGSDVTSNSKDPDVEEEYQIQLAMEMSAREDPEAAQIEAVKQISLGSCTTEHTPAELVAFRYWNHNALGYDDKILDGFYDLYGLVAEYVTSKMPSLNDLQSAPVSEDTTWESILVNRAADMNLLKLEQRAQILAVRARSDPLVLRSGELVQQLAALVSDYMGGPVGEPDKMLRAWKSLSYRLKSTLQSMVLPLGSLTIGLARHRALLFKVLADSVDIPCRLVKGQLYTGFDDVAMNYVKIDDEREFIVDLMADPGTLIPSDAVITRVDSVESPSFTSLLSRDVELNMGTCSSEGPSSFGEPSDSGTLDATVNLREAVPVDDKGDRCPSDASVGQQRLRMHYEESETSTECSRNPKYIKSRIQEIPSGPSYAISHARSPSWTEGVSSPAAHKMKVKDVSQYMIDAAKENPQLAQKLHDVLLESGVIAPPNLFSEIYADDSNVSFTAAKHQVEGTQGYRKKQESNCSNQNTSVLPQFLPALPYPGGPSRGIPGQQQGNLESVRGSHTGNVVDLGEGITNLALQPDIAPVKIGKNVPVAAAAAAAAAVVASSMVAAVAKSNPDPKFELPVAAAATATATAAAVVATTAAVGKQYEQLEASPCSPGVDVFFNQMIGFRSEDTVGVGHEARGSDKDQDSFQGNSEERISDRSAGGDSASSAKTDMSLDDVADCEISWDEISLGERIGLGSYGEVYRGDWHGTEVAVKRFLDQDISGESLEEFKSEVRIMKRLRHPNVVLFMGAITRPPNLSIVTEFLHRGSLYRLIHRLSNQLDERKRLRMAFDTARGMNYLHNCSPVIVHRDLKSPNLLVDKNWVVKVCDFGLSRMKHNTFLSSRSNAGTAEWMAPEVLRNEPSDEKCDVYSFGVILWELCTLQQPWGGMNPMQVVGAVGFQHRRLDIPDDIDPAIADIIRKCWQTDPKLRPTFSEIMAALKPLQKPMTGLQVTKTTSRSSSHGKV